MLNGDDLPPLLRGHYPASLLLRGSAPLSGASVLSASRLEPLAPCMGSLLSSGFRAAISLSCSVSLFDLESRFFAPTRSIAKPARAGAVKVGRRTNLSTCSALARPYLDSSEHGGTLGAVGMTIRGEPAFGRVSIAPQPCIRWVQGPEP